MATGSVSLINVASVVSLATTDSLFVNSNNSVRQANANEVFSNSNVEVLTLLVGNNVTPANSSSNAEQGTFWFDSSYIYVATANNVIKRVALSSF
jgi:hypothetical protein